MKFCLMVTESLIISVSFWDTVSPGSPGLCNIQHRFQLHSTWECVCALDICIRPAPLSPLTRKPQTTAPSYVREALPV